MAFCPARVRGSLCEVGRVSASPLTHYQSISDGACECESLEGTQVELLIHSTAYFPLPSISILQIFLSCGAVSGASNGRAPTLSISTTIRKYTDIFLAHTKMSNPATNEDTKQNDAGGGALIKMAGFESLTLPLFTSEDEVEANNSSSQMEKLTPSTPILMLESKAVNTIASNIPAAFVAPARSFKQGIRVNKLLENYEQHHTVENAHFQTANSTKLAFITLTHHILFVAIWTTGTLADRTTMAHPYVQSGPANMPSWDLRLSTCV